MARKKSIYPFVFEYEKSSGSIRSLFGYDCQNLATPETIEFVPYCINSRTVIDKVTRWTTATPNKEGGCDVQSHLYVLRMLTPVTGCNPDGWIKGISQKELRNYWNDQTLGMTVPK
jgi:hypothetical protein